MAANIGSYGVAQFGYNGHISWTSSTNKGTAGAQTASYVTQNIFLPQYGSLKLASTYSGLAAASVIANIKTIQLTIAKNIEDDITIGNTSPVDRLNKQLAITGQLKSLTMTAR